VAGRYIADGSGESPHDKQLAVLGHRAMLKMMLQHNFIHSDLHPGNIMVRLDPLSNMFMQAAAKLCSIAGLGKCNCCKLCLYYLVVQVQDKECNVEVLVVRSF
jgi:predicted unusual protein kinase regulating ubiquinone biosynthesis (AarF/ABC1/UbiB family)